MVTQGRTNKVISMIEWIRTSRLSIKSSLSIEHRNLTGGGGTLSLVTFRGGFVSKAHRLVYRQALEAHGVACDAEMAGGFSQDLDIYSSAFATLGLPPRMLAPRLQPVQVYFTEMNDS